LPGKYRISASADGFKTSIREGFELQVSQTLSIDLKLEVGAVTETSTLFRPRRCSTPAHLNPARSSTMRS
jgi:hypothetical protein